MKGRLNKFIIRLPEYYLIIVVFLTGYQPPLSANPLSIGLVFILLLQIYFRNSISGVILAALFVMANLYMALALISEFLEFTTFNAGAAQLIIGGGLLIMFNLLMSGIMIFKYTRESEKPNVEANGYE